METPDPSDVALVAAIAEGRVEALGVLYDRHAAVLFAVALRIVRTEAAAADVLHDAMLLVFDRARTFDAARGSVPAWLITIVRNLSLDRARTTGRRAGLLDRLGEDLAPAAALDPETATAGAETAARVRAAMASLPEEQRRVLLASFFEGLTYDEIAAREAIPLGTVKSRAARAMHALAALLADTTAGR